MKITWFENTESIISFSVQLFVIILLLVCTLFSVFKVIKRPKASILIVLIFFLSLFAFVFNYTYLFIISAVIGSTILFFSFVCNIGDFRKFFANPFGSSSSKKTPFVEKIYNKKELFQVIEQSVIDLSERKIGALITLQKNSNLHDICKNGVEINAPFSKELILTIFYPGTRLHDGAVIIKDDMITSASVFYTPTTKPFATKYGSRHRAALGISEITDAVTIVVSEETGFVSIAYEGSIQHVEAENLAKILANYF